MHGAILYHIPNSFILFALAFLSAVWYTTRRSFQIKDENFKLDLPRVEYWLSKGAQPSTTVASLIRRAKNPSLKPHHATPAKKVEAKKEA